MKKLFTLFLILFSTLFGGTLAAQELKVASFEPLPQDVAARSNAVLDNNDNPCALLRVVVAVEGIEIRGNYGRVGDVISPRASEYVVYLPAGTKTLYVNCPGFMPLTYDIGYKLEGKMAYRLTLERPQLAMGPTKPEIKRQHVKITLPTPSSTVLIDGMPQQTSNGAFFGTFSLGKHTYYISAPQHYPEEGEFTLTTSGRIDLTVALKPSYMPLNLRVSPANATVQIDGQMLTLTRGQLTQKFEIGKHTYQISAPQHYTQTGEFEILATGQNSLNFNLKPSYMALNLRVSPSNATVMIDGDMITLTGGQLTQKFEIGKHSYQISAPQHYTQSGEFEITALGQNALAVNLKPSYMALNLRVSPANATVQIDGEMITPTGGQLTRKFEIGKHTYQIMASQYHSVSGEFEITALGGTDLDVTLKPAFGFLQATSNPVGAEVRINGEKRGVTPCKLQLPSGQYSVQLVSDGYISHAQQVTITDGVTLPFSNTLTANFAQITLKAPHPHSEIWVNDQFKAKGEWSGRLDANTYLVEARTEGYETVSENVEVVAGVPRTVTLQQPNPIYGLLEILSEPFDATIKLDGKVVGTTPWQSNEVLTGKHSLEIAKEGYNLYSQEFTLTKESPVTIEALLDNTPTTFQVGDYYNQDGKEGVVFWVDASGRHGKILSMTESGSELEWSSDKYEQKRLIGADSETDGAKNMAVVKQISDWESKYPAFKWCADLGEGWYLPAKEELKIFTLNDAVYDKVNRTLSQHGGKPLANKGDSYYWDWYWSSTESSKKDSTGYFRAWIVNMYSGLTYGSSKYLDGYVRAVSAF